MAISVGDKITGDIINGHYIISQDTNLIGDHIWEHYVHNPETGIEDISRGLSYSNTESLDIQIASGDINC